MAGNPSNVTPGSLPRPHAADPKPTSRRAAWAKRAGAGLFLFFLIKGLLWLIVPTALVLGARFFAQ